MSIKDFDRLMKLFNLAKDVKVASISKVKMVSAIYVKNELVSLGQAQDRTHPFAAKYCRTPIAVDGCYDKNNAAIVFHAETHAIHNALRTYPDLKNMNATIYVARAKKNKSHGDYIWGSSRPCEGCNRAIRDYNLNVVFMEDEFILKEKRVSYWKK